MAHPFSNRPTFDGIHEGLFGFGEGRPLAPAADAALADFARRASLNGECGWVWQCYAAEQAETFAALRSRDPVDREYLYGSLFGTPLTHGFAQGHVAQADLIETEYSRIHVGIITLDRLYRLAEAVGVAQVKSAEHDQNTITVGDVDAVLDSIENAIGSDISPPAQAGRLFGIKTKRGIYSDRHFDGIYGAWRARQVLAQSGHLTDTLVEIGGGAGYLAYYARLFGFRRVTVIDLPQAICAQYILLADAFGEACVKLDGPVMSGIRLALASNDAADLIDGAQIVVNVDSFPEMPRSAAAAYLAAIPRGIRLLSINQESAIPNGDGWQNVVFELAAEHGLRRLSRFPAWLRTGWVEEVYAS